MKEIVDILGNYERLEALMIPYFRDGEDADTPIDEICEFIEALYHMAERNEISGAILSVDGVDAGFVLFMQDRADSDFSELVGYGTILEIGLAPDFKGKGLGRTLVRHAESELEAIGIDEYYVSAYGPAQSFWLHMGYEPTARLAHNGLELHIKKRIEYRRLSESDITGELFYGFSRRQDVKECYRRENGAWAIKPVAFIDDWSEKEYAEVIAALINTVRTGGAVFGAFKNGTLKGIASMEAELFGGENKYVDMSLLIVSEEMRFYGIGRKLFNICCDWAREHGARKLYISAHSSVETQMFYRDKMGCVDAKELNARLVEKEPFDCQLEYEL